MSTTATFTKLKDGNWGLRVDGDVPAIGSQVTVSKKDGTTTQAKIGAVLWSGIARNGKKSNLCTIAARAARATRRRQPCGYPGCTGENFCDECTE